MKVEVMAAKGIDRNSWLGRLKNKNDMEKKQRKLVLSKEINNNRNDEKKKVSFAEIEKDSEVRYEADRLEKVKKELINIMEMNELGRKEKI